MSDGFSLPQPCPDVYWYPLMSEAFCDELVEVGSVWCVVCSVCGVGVVCPTQ